MMQEGEAAGVKRLTPTAVTDARTPAAQNNSHQSCLAEKQNPQNSHDCLLLLLSRAEIFITAAAIFLYKHLSVSQMQICS